MPSSDPGGSTLFTSVVSGVLLTLGDVKAILFYASLFPAFVDMAHLTLLDVVAIVGITIATVGGVKIAYALAARRIVKRLQARCSEKHGRAVAGGLMVGTGTYLIAKT